MSEPRRPTRAEVRDDDDTEATERDPELDSTWNTIGGASDVADITDEDELEDMLVEPTGGELGTLADTAVPGRPG
jgi:hypothetical protein